MYGLLGSGICDDIKTEKVKWHTDGITHSYTWITADHNKGMMTLDAKFWK